METSSEEHTAPLIVSTSPSTTIRPASRIASFPTLFTPESDAGASPSHASSNSNISSWKKEGGFRREYMYRNDQTVHSDFCESWGKKEDLPLVSQVQLFRTLFQASNIRDPAFPNFNVHDSTPSIVSNSNLDILHNEVDTDSSMTSEEIIEAQVSKKLDKGGNILTTILLILKSFVGMALLYVPHIFSLSGSVFGLVLVLSFFVICLMNMLELVSCAVDSDSSLGQVAERAFGKQGRIVVDASTFMAQCSFCTSYMMIVASNIRDLVLSIANCDTHYNLNLILLMIIQIPLYIPLSWVRRLSYFSFAATLADVLLVLSFVAICGYSLVKIASGKIAPIRLYHQKWPVALGMIGNLWEGITLVLPIKNSMKRDVKHHFPLIFGGTLCVICLCYILVSVLSNLAYGPDVPFVVLYALPNTLLVYIIQIFITLTLLVSFPLMLFPSSALIEKYFLNYSSLTVSQKWYKNSERGFLVLFIFCLAWLGLKQLDNFIAIVGAICSIPLALIYPPLLILKLKRNQNIFEKLRHIIFVTVGFAVIFVVLYETISTWATTVVPSRCNVS